MANSTKTRSFDGRCTQHETILSEANKWFVDTTTPMVPPWMHTHHLTVLTFFWAALILLAGFLYQLHHYWLWLAILSVAGHIITDALDGSVGRKRQTGLARWGYYTDHFGDYLLNCAIIISFQLISPALNPLIIITMLVTTNAFFMHAYLSTTLFKKFILTFFNILGPLEGQFFYIFLYLIILLFGPQSLSISLPITIIFLAIAIAIIFIKTQRQLWQLDRPKF